MKKVYEKPVMYVEQFAVNAAVSTCTVEGGIEWKFDCMVGSTEDSTNVISTSIDGVEAACKLNIGYAEGVLTARDYASAKEGIGHSNYNPSISTWNDTRSSSKGQISGYVEVVYSKGEGLLYTDGGNGSNDKCWTVTDGIVTHSSKSGGTHHMVAPVLDSRSIKASW